MDSQMTSKIFCFQTLPGRNFFMDYLRRFPKVQMTCKRKTDRGQYKLAVLLPKYRVEAATQAWEHYKKPYCLDLINKVGVRCFLEHIKPFRDQLKHLTIQSSSVLLLAHYDLMKYLILCQQEYLDNGMIQISFIEPHELMPTHDKRA